MLVLAAGTSSPTVTALWIALWIALLVVVVIGLFRRGLRARAADGASRASEPAESDAESARESGGIAGHNELAVRIRQLQEAYWSFQPDELQALMASSLDDLAWPQKFRLLHLSAMQLLQTEPGTRQHHGDRDATFAEMVGVAEPEIAARCRALVRTLTAPESPYRPRQAAVWKGTPAGDRNPDHVGRLTNASFTHLGAFEVIRLDADHLPVELAFVGLDEIRGAFFHGSAARLFYDDGRPDEVVMVPLLYGLSWQSTSAIDHTGTMTRFCSHITVHDDQMNQGIGIGQQDFTVEQADGSALFGISSIAEIMLAPEISDPKFDQRCHARGLNPDEVRQTMKPGP